jgi:RING finger protein 113A
MFRKPSKKKDKAAFRKPGGGPASAPATASGKYRKRSNNSSSSDEEEEDGQGGDGHGSGGGGATSDLLEQIRREKRQQTKKKRRVGGGDDDDDEGGSASASASAGVMHQFLATDRRPTEKEMATRTAEHHPTAITQGLEKKAGDEGGNGAPAATASSSTEDGDNGKVYQGQNAGQSRNKFLAGPLKAPSFVRTTCRFDYQPDICKDYKDTGFCGFGDTCIYLHDRGDTLTGWQLEAQYEEKKKAEKEQREKEMDRFLARASGEAGEEEDDAAAAVANDGLPFACYICRKPFTEPLVTNCGHYYCQACIMKHVRQGTPACPICSKDTGGVFNHPAKLISKKRRLVGGKATWEEFAEAAR